MNSDERSLATKSPAPSGHENQVRGDVISLNRADHLCMLRASVGETTDVEAGEALVSDRS